MTFVMNASKVVNINTTHIIIPIDMLAIQLTLGSDV